MQNRLNPYLGFKDNAREAMEFYKTIFGGKLEQHTFKEHHASQDPGEDDKIMHSVLEADNGIMFMAADTPNDMQYQPGSTMSMSLSGDNDVELSKYFEKLSEGGTTRMPLDIAPWVTGSGWSPTGSVSTCGGRTEGEHREHREQDATHQDLPSE